MSRLRWPDPHNPPSQIPGTIHSRRGWLQATARTTRSTRRQCISGPIWDSNPRRSSTFTVRGEAFPASECGPRTIETPAACFCRSLPSAAAGWRLTNPPGFWAPRALETGTISRREPRWTAEKRPIVDGSNPAISAGGRDIGVLPHRFLRAQVCLHLCPPAPGAAFEHVRVVEQPVEERGHRGRVP